MDSPPPTIELPDDQMVEIFRAKTPAEKIGMIAAAHRTARMLAAAGIRYRHPDWSDSQIEAEAIRRVTRGTG